MPATFKFLAHESRKDVNGEAPIYLRITCDKKKKYYNTGERIDPSYIRKNPDVGYWIKKSHPNYNTLNKDVLEPLFHKAKRIASELRRNRRESAEAIKNRLQGATKDNFFTIADEELDQLDKEDQFYLKKQTNATLSKLKEYLAYKGHDPEVLKFTEVTPGLIEGFQDWMQDEKGNKGATIRKNRSDVRRILKLAEKHKLIFDDPFEGVKPPKKEKPKPKVKLTYQQIQAIQKLSLKEGSYEYHAQNAFILAFYLNGLRFGDVAKMKWDQINNGRLEYRMSKSVKPVYIKIPEAAQQFLSRYRDKGGVYVFPFLEGLPKQDKDTIETRISGELAKVNEAIKEVAKQAGIKESVADQVSTHVARHSLAMYLVNEEYSIYDVSKALRHSSVTTTENYLDRLGLQAKDQTVESPFS